MFSGNRSSDLGGSVHFIELIFPWNGHSRNYEWWFSDKCGTNLLKKDATETFNFVDLKQNLFPNLPLKKKAKQEQILLTKEKIFKEKGNGL